MKSIFNLLTIIACVGVAHAALPDTKEAVRELQRPDIDCKKQFLFITYTDSACEDLKSVRMASYKLEREQCIASQEAEKAYRNSIAQLREEDQLGKPDGEQCSDAVDCVSGYCFPGPSYPDEQLSYCISADKNCAFPGEVGVKYGEIKSYSGEKFSCSKPERGRGSYWKRLSPDPANCSSLAFSESEISECKDDNVTIYTGRNQFIVGKGETLCFEPKDENWRWFCGKSVALTKSGCQRTKLIQAGRSKSGQLITWLCFSSTEHRNETIAANAAPRLPKSLIGVWQTPRIRVGGALSRSRAVLRIDERVDDRTYFGELTISRSSPGSFRASSKQKVKILVDGIGVRIHPLSVEKLTGEYDLNNYLPDFLELRSDENGNLGGPISDSNGRWGRVLLRKQ